jgi:hypothetical protein
MAVNLRAPFLLAQLALPAMIGVGFGRILLVSSFAAFTGGTCGPHYAASKGRPARTGALPGPTGRRRGCHGQRHRARPDRRAPVRCPSIPTTRAPCHCLSRSGGWEDLTKSPILRWRCCATPTSPTRSSAWKGSSPGLTNLKRGSRPSGRMNTPTAGRWVRLPATRGRLNREHGPLPGALAAPNPSRYTGW